MNGASGDRFVHEIAVASRDAEIIKPSVGVARARTWRVASAPRDKTRSLRANDRRRTSDECAESVADNLYGIVERESLGGCGGGEGCRAEMVMEGERVS